MTTKRPRSAYRPVYIDVREHTPDWLEKFIMKTAIAQGINFVSRTPIGSGIMAMITLQELVYDKYGIYRGPLGVVMHDEDHPFQMRLWRNRGKPSTRIGAPIRTTPTSTISSNRRQGRASAEPGKHGRPPSTRKESRARRKPCPKGHYWSYKEKKCVKSRFGQSSKKIRRSQ